LKSRKEKNIIVEAKFNVPTDSTLYYIFKRANMLGWRTYKRYANLSAAEEAIKTLNKNGSTAHQEFRIKQS